MLVNDHIPIPKLTKHFGGVWGGGILSDNDDDDDDDDDDDVVDDHSNYHEEYSGSSLKCVQYSNKYYVEAILSSPQNTQVEIRQARNPLEMTVGNIC